MPEVRPSDEDDYLNDYAFDYDITNRLMRLARAAYDSIYDEEGQLNCRCMFANLGKHTEKCLELQRQLNRVFIISEEPYGVED